MMDNYENGQDRWNEIYAEDAPVDLRNLNLNVETLFDTCLKMFAEKTSHVLDFGCGTGDILFQYAQYQKHGIGVGVDPAENGIAFAKETAKKSGYKNLHFFCGDTKFLDTFEKGEFNGIILSNVLDVMTKEESREMLTALNRVLNDDGYWFVKLNPYYSKEELKEMEYEDLGNNMYGKNGVLYLRQESTEHWMQVFGEFAEVDRYVEFPYSWQPGMNRIFLLKKKSSEERSL